MSEEKRLEGRVAKASAAVAPEPEGGIMSQPPGPRKRYQPATPRKRDQEGKFTPPPRTEA